MTVRRSHLRPLAAVGRVSVALLLLGSATCGEAVAQELEPGAYWPIPAGLNILTVILARVFGPADLTKRGGTIAFYLLAPDGAPYDVGSLQDDASRAGLSIRTGCF